MKTLEKILITVLVLAIAVVAVAYLLPSQWSVSRSIVISAPSASIHPYIENFRRWHDWMPWTAEMDPSIKYEYFGPESGKDAGQSWNGDKSGSGSMTITQSDAATGIVYSLQFGGEKYPTEGSMRYDADQNGTKVTWSSSGELGNNPISRYFGLLMDSMMGADFDKGLSKLKRVVEHGAQ